MTAKTGLGTNVASLQAQRRLGEATSALSRSSERLASGLRINHASDDAAGLAIATSLSADTRIYSQAIRNVNDGLSFMSIAEGALQQLSAITVRQKELAEQSANGVFSLPQRKALDTEANALVDEFNRIVSSTSFNGQVIFDPSRNGGKLSIQAGYGASGVLEVSVGAALSRAVGTGGYQTAGSASAGNFPGVIRSGDFNGDGNADLLTANYFEGTSTVLIGNGDGTFKAAVTLAGTGFGVTDAVVGDFNGDGKLDVAVADNGGKISLVLGNGDGTFKARSLAYQSNAGATNLLSGDFDGDGNQDLAVGDVNGQSVRVLRGSGTGTFTAARSIATGGHFTALASGDFNGDGRTDIAVGLDVAQKLSVFAGQASGDLSLLSTINSVNSRSITAADFNHDGITDIAQGGWFNDIQVFQGRGDGTFSPARSYSAPGLSWSIQSGDVDGDGLTDLVNVDYYGSVQVLSGNADGTFRQTALFAGAARPRSGAIVSLRGTAALDIITGERGSGTINVILADTKASDSIARLDLLTQASARSALPHLDAQLNRINAELGNLGAYQSRFESALNSLRSRQDNYTAAASRIMDTDVASESAELVRRSIQQQMAAGVLAQANQAPQLALRLLQG